MAQCFYCCYCDILCALTQKDLKSIKEYQPLEPELEDWQKAIDIQRRPGEMALTIGYRQVIHKHCLALISKETLLAIKKKNPNNQSIPQRSENKLLVIGNIGEIPRDCLCLRCENGFRENYLGFVFRLSHQTESHYIHADCYQIMLDYQAR